MDKSGLESLIELLEEMVPKPGIFSNGMAHTWDHLTTYTDIVDDNWYGTSAIAYSNSTSSEPLRLNVVKKSNNPTEVQTEVQKPHLLATWRRVKYFSNTWVEVDHDDEGEE